MLPEYDPQHVLHWPVFQPQVKKNPCVPRIIHQMWLGDNPPLDLMGSWKKRNPGWAYMLWTEETLRGWKFINEDKIAMMSEPNGKCDIMRYEILYHLGGFFADADTVCRRPLDESLFTYDCVTCFEGLKQRGGLLACGFMAAQRGCRLMRLCIEEMDKIKSPAWWYVGPVYFTHIVQKHQYPIKIHPDYYFIPKHYAGPMYTGAGPVYCDHLWGNTLPNGYQRYQVPSYQKPVVPRRLPTRRPTIQQRRTTPLRGCTQQGGILCQYRHMEPGPVPNDVAIQGIGPDYTLMPILAIPKD